MPVTKVGIVYSKNQQVIRRTYDPRWSREQGYTFSRGVHAPWAHDDLLTPHKNRLHPAERWAEIPIEVYDSHTHPQQTHDHLGLTGIPGETDRHAVVDDQGNVVAVVCGDPSIDTHPHGKLVHHLEAVTGDKIINGQHIKAADTGTP